MTVGQRIDQRIERPYRVRFDEAGPDGNLRASGYLRFAQDLAWIHSESAGFGRDWYGARGLTWLVRAIELDVLAEVAYGSEISVSTEVIGFRRVWARRRSEFTPGGEARLVGLAITDWVLLNAQGRPVRPPHEIRDAFGPQVSEFTPLRLHEATPVAEATHDDFVVRRSELDPMGHVNNAAYLDYLDELYLTRAGHAVLGVPRRYRAEFIASAEAGAHLASVGWPDEQIWRYRLEDGTGRELFRARLETDQPTWVGG